MLPNKKCHNETVVKDDVMLTRPEVSVNPEKLNALQGEIVSAPIGGSKQVSIEDADPVKEEHSSLNTKALPNKTLTYELERFEKNILIIFNQEIFDIPNTSERKGTDKDVEALINTFTKFGFDFIVHKDLKKDDIFKELKKFLNEKNLTNYGCVAAAVLTHGSDNGYLSARDDNFSETEFKNLFKSSNQTLLTKPKIVIFQAYSEPKSDGIVYTDHDETVVPKEMDILVLRSSYNAYPTDWNQLEGTWFIQELCRKIDSLSTSADLEEIMEAVNKEAFYGNRPQPETTNTLTRKLYLRKFGDQPPIVNTVTDGPFTSDVTKIPRPVQLGRCSCNMYYYNYMKTCLESIVKVKPEDETAKYYLELVKSFSDGGVGDVSKEIMSKVIELYLSKEYKTAPGYEYLYLRNH